MAYHLTMKQLDVMLRLYSIKKGTMKDIAKACGTRRECGMIYKMKPIMLSYGIIIETKRSVFNDFFMTSEFKINHKELDRFLMTETILNRLYERIWDGNMMTMKKMVSKEGWNGGV